MQRTSLEAISPVDGRYAEKLKDYRLLFSEYGLIKQRYEIEIRWLQHLASLGLDEIPPLSQTAQEYLQTLITLFNQDAAIEIKQIEHITNHDVKAVEYFLKQQLDKHDELKAYSEFIHFACTSEDINNLAYANILQQAREMVLIPQMQQLHSQLTQLAKQHAQQAMLARTHGQAATPTTVGKEFANIAARLQRQLSTFNTVTITAKFNGAVGNYNAHSIAYPNIDWPLATKHFIEQFGLQQNPYTTQVEPHDWIAEYCHVLQRFNTILIDASRDLWGYISLEYFKQRVKADEVGFKSSSCCFILAGKFNC